MEVEIVGWNVDVHLLGSSLQQQPFFRDLQSIFFRWVVRVRLLNRPWDWHRKPNREHLNIHLFFLPQNLLALVDQ